MRSSEACRPKISRIRFIFPSIPRRITSNPFSAKRESRARRTDLAIILPLRRWMTHRFPPEEALCCTQHQPLRGNVPKAVVEGETSCSNCLCCSCAIVVHPFHPLTLSERCRTAAHQPFSVSAASSGS